MSHTTPTQGNINHSMRTNYNEFGVDEYYRKVNASYRNPFFPGIRKVIFALLDRWWKEESSARVDNEDEGTGWELRILDMAAGSGEATLIIEEWYNARFPSSSSSGSARDPTKSTTSNPAIRNPLASLGMASSRLPVVARPAFVPPHRKEKQAEPAIGSGSLQDSGQGPAGLASARRKRPKLVIMATDAYTVPAYESRTGKPCLPLSFQDIAQGELAVACPDGKPFDMIICSFALHLVGDSSEMFSLLYELSQRARWLAVVAPHKKPDIKDGWGYARWNFGSWKTTLDAGVSAEDADDEDEKTSSTQSREGLVNQGQELVLDRVRCRLYRSVDL